MYINKVDQVPQGTDLCTFVTSVDLSMIYEGRFLELSSYMPIDAEGGHRLRT